MRDTKDIKYSLKEELYGAISLGIGIMIDGKTYSKENLEEGSVLLEDGHYMRDFTANDGGKIIMIHYDRIYDSSI